MHEITVNATSYTPNDIDVCPGDTVRWVCSSGSHNVNGTQQQYANNPESFGNSVMAGPWTYEHVFTINGIYDYRCDIHFAIGMSGVINVVGAGDPSFNYANTTLCSSAGIIGASITGTTAIALKLLNRVNTQTEAQDLAVTLWNQRNKTRH